MRYQALKDINFNVNFLIYYRFTLRFFDYYSPILSRNFAIILPFQSRGYQRDQGLAIEGIRGERV